MSGIFKDYSVNRQNIKGRIVLVAFRIANLGTKNKLAFFLLLPHLVLYRLIVEWFLGIELPWKTTVGKGLTLYHGHATVINDGSILGSNCTVRHCTTIGNKQLKDGSFSRCPVIGDHVDIGSNVCIIGPVTIGNNVKIGAGSIVVKDVPSNCIVAGNPAKIIKQL